MKPYPLKSISWGLRPKKLTAKNDGSFLKGKGSDFRPIINYSLKIIYQNKTNHGHLIKMVILA